MSKKINIRNRFLELDLLRIVAIILIFVQHLLHLCIPEEINAEQCYYLLNIGKFSPGEMGVSLFIFLSGLTLTKFSIKKKNIRSYYLTRMIRLFVPFWLTYIPILIFLLANKTFSFKINLLSAILSFFGMNGYLGSFFPINGWYILGEWFFGFIIIVYIIYPILNNLFNRNKVLFLLLCFLTTYFYSKMQTPMILRVIPVRIMEFSIGMYFATKLNNKVSFLKITLLIIILFLIGELLKYGTIFLLIKLLIIDIIIYDIARIIAKLISFKKLNILENIKKIIVYLSEISFPFFLIHHVVIQNIISVFKNCDKSYLGSNMHLYILITITISFILSHLVLKTNYIILDKIRKKQLIS